MTEEERERIEQETSGQTEEQETAISSTFGYDDEEQEEPEQPKGEEEEETEEPEGEETEEQEESEQGDDGIEDIFGESQEEESEEAEEEGETEEQEEGESEDGEYEPLDLTLSEDEYEEITSDPEKFSDFISQVREDAIKQAEQSFNKKLDERSAEIEEQILKNIPDVVNKSQTRAQRVKQARDKFYEDYPDLQNKKGYVRDMTATVSSQNPDWGAKEVLEEVGKRAERDLQIAKAAQKREQERDNPKFAGAGGRRNPGGSGDGRTKQQKLMDDTF